MSFRKRLLEEFEENGFDIDRSVQGYLEWGFDDKYLILARFETKTILIRDNKYHQLLRVDLPDPDSEAQVFAIKCSKRGNDVYRHRTYRRFKDLVSISEKIEFFNPRDRRLKKKTRALFVTLTYDTKRCSLVEAWINIGDEFNRFISYIRKQFGKVSCCRVFEAFNNGYVHVHCVLLFEEKESKVFRDKRGKFRIQEKFVFESGWHSHTDVQAMGSLGWGFRYLKKYLLKSIDVENQDPKTLKT